MTLVSMNIQLWLVTQSLKGISFWSLSLSRSSCQDAKVHQNFRSKVKAINVSYDVDKTSLIVIVSCLCYVIHAFLLSYITFTLVQIFLFSSPIFHIILYSLYSLTTEGH